MAMLAVRKIRLSSLWKGDLLKSAMRRHSRFLIISAL